MPDRYQHRCGHSIAKFTSEVNTNARPNYSMSRFLTFTDRWYQPGLETLLSHQRYLSAQLCSTTVLLCGIMHLYYSEKAMSTWSYQQLGATSFSIKEFIRGSSRRILANWARHARVLCRYMATACFVKDRRAIKCHWRRPPSYALVWS